MSNLTPNLLVVMVDEHAPQASEVYGHSYVKTPALAALAASGVVFDRAYCDSPLCVPSRMAFMSGQKVFRTKVWDNSAALRSDVPTVAHLLAGCGYDTVLSGKMHFKGPDQLHGFARRLVEDCCYPGITSVPDWDRPVTPSPGALERFRQAGPVRHSAGTAYDDRVEQASLRYLEEYQQSGQQRPFALFTCFNAPHFPLTPEPEYFERYAAVTTMPRVAPTGASPLPPALRRLQIHFGLDRVSDDEMVRARAAYFGLVTQTDARVGRLRGALEALDLQRPTVVIYTADHGEMMGEHGLWWKCNFYEEAVRIPLIVSWPGEFPVRREAMPVSLVDVTATIAGLAAGSAPGLDLDGRDLTPVLRGAAGDPERVVTSEYHAHGAQHSMRMVRQGRYKLTYVVGEGVQLFDMEADPQEWFDLSADARYADVVHALRDQAQKEWPDAMETEVRASQRLRRTLAQANQVLPDLYVNQWASFGA